MKNGRKKKKWIEYLVLSSAIHLILIYFWGSEMGIMESRFIDKDMPVDIYRLERQVVSIDYDTEEELNKYARYLSKADRRVLDETKARKWGKPYNIRESFDRILEEDLDDAIDRYIEERERRRDEDGESTTYDYLPDVKPGEQTILNTAEFIFYSFYRRVQEAIVPNWNDYVSEYIDSRPAIRESLGKRNYITEVEAIITPEGDFVRMVILRSSGVAGIDNAPGRAFAESSPFENPPEGMVGDDGMLRMRWRFIVSVVERFRFDVQDIGSPYRGLDPALEREMYR